MSFTEEDIRSHLPYYLTQESKIGIVRALKDFPENMSYYTGTLQDEILQGDGWNSLEVISFESGQKKPIKGILLSNSCDISAENTRELPARLVFAPIIKLGLYQNLLVKSGVSGEKLHSKLNAIRNQRVTSLFYLPSGGQLKEDYVAVLDDLHSLPAQYFQSKNDKTKQFTLSQAGFYLFVLKLSIHFCRFHEGVERNM